MVDVFRKIIELERSKTPTSISQLEIMEEAGCGCGSKSCPMVVNMVRMASCHQGFVNRETKGASTVSGQELAMAEVDWTGSEHRAFSRELLVEAARDVLHQSRVQSQIQVKTVLAQKQLRCMKKIYKREKIRMLEMAKHGSSMKKIMDSLHHVLHQSCYPLDILQLLDKDVWTEQEVMQSKSFLLEILRFRELKGEICGILKFLMDSIPEREEDIMQMEAAILAHQEVEVRMRVTPTQRQSSMKIGSLSLRPGEKQVTVSKDKVILEEATITEDGKVVLIENQKLRKTATVATTGEPPISHRVLWLKREDLTEDEDEVPMEEQDSRIMEVIKLSRTPNPLVAPPPDHF